MKRFHYHHCHQQNLYHLLLWQTHRHHHRLRMMALCMCQNLHYFLAPEQQVRHYRQERRLLEYFQNHPAPDLMQKLNYHRLHYHHLTLLHR